MVLTSRGNAFKLSIFKKLSIVLYSIHKYMYMFILTRKPAIPDKPARRVYRSVKVTKHSTIITIILGQDPSQTKKSALVLQVSINQSINQSV